jgi:hypothetical protein
VDDDVAAAEWKLRCRCSGLVPQVELQRISFAKVWPSGVIVSARPAHELWTIATRGLREPSAVAFDQATRTIVTTAVGRQYESLPIEEFEPLVRDVFARQPASRPDI